jgi:tetratricopeptide (TPR) repeat protein
MFFVGELYREGAMPRAEFAAARDRWIAGEKARGTVRRYPWVDGYAIPARTDADALEAVQVLPGYALPDRLDLAPEWEGPIGRVLLRAGRLDEATAHLSRAAHSCAIFEAPFEQMAATLDLGAAYEAADNPSAACDAYRSVLGRWGRAPLSLTAGKARVRAAALGCAAPARAR